MYRFVDDETEAVQLAYTLQGIVEKSPGWQGRFNPETAIEKWKAGYFQAIVVDEEYLVLYAVESPWYNDQIIEVWELFVCRVGKGVGGKGKALQGIDKALIDIAKKHGASRIAVGTSLPKNNKALARLYQRLGYEINAISLTKEL
jgi:hypothetical protein